MSVSPSGIGPTEISKSWYCPGPIEPPLQVMVDTASVTVPSSVVSGVVSGFVWTSAVHPGTGLTLTDANG